MPRHHGDRSARSIPFPAAYKNSVRRDFARHRPSRDLELQIEIVRIVDVHEFDGIRNPTTLDRGEPAFAHVALGAALHPRFAPGNVEARSLAGGRTDKKIFPVAPKCVTCSARIQTEDTPWLRRLPPLNASRSAEPPSERRGCDPSRSGYLTLECQALPRSVRVKPQSPMPQTGQTRDSASSRKKSPPISPNTSTPSRGRLRHLRWPDGPVAMSRPRSEPTDRHRRRVRRAAPRRPRASAVVQDYIA